MTNDVELIGLDELIAMTGISRSKLFEMLKAGTLPAQAKLGGRSSKWWKADIVAWLKARRTAQKVIAQ